MSKKTIILFACTLALLIAALAFAFWNSALVARLSDEIAAADSQNKQLSQQVTDLTAQLTATQTQRDTLSKQLTDEKTLANSTQTTLNQQLTDLSAQMSTEQTAAAAAQATLNQQVTDLSSQLADEKAAAADLQTALGTANQQIAQLEKDVLEQQSAANVAQAKCELLTTQLGKSEDELARARTEIASLQTQLITAHKDNSALKTENTTLSGQLSDAQASISSLNAANTQLTQEKQDISLTLSARTVDIGTLQKKLETLQLQFDSLTADHTALQTDNTALKSENAALTARIASLESQLTSAQNAPSTAIQLEGMSGEELLDLIDKAHNQFIELTCRVVNSSGGGYSGNQSIDVALDDRYIIRDLKIGPEDFRTNPQLLAPVMSGAFVNQFIGMPCPINAEDIDFVAGATETCNTIIELINSSYEHLLNDTEVNNRQIDAAYVHSTLAIGTAESLIDNVSVIVGIDENGKTTFVTLNPSLSPVAAAFTDKCNDPEYLATFTGISYLTEPSDIHVMTGATYTSRAIAKAIDNAYENAGALGRSVDTIYSFCPEESLAVEGGEMRFAAHFDQDGTILHIDSYGTDERTQAFLNSLIGLDPDALEMRGDDGISQNDEILEMLLDFLYESVL